MSNIADLKELASSVDFWGTTTGFNSDKLCEILSFAVNSAEKLKEAGRANSAQSDHINQQQDRIDSLEQKNAALGNALGTAERERGELRAGHTEAAKVISTWHKRAKVAEAELERRDAAVGEPVAWLVGGWAFYDRRSAERHSECENLLMEPLYTAPQPAVLPVLEQDVKNIIGLLSGNEWAEHCTKSELGRELEGEVARLQDLRAQQQKVVELPAVRKIDDVAYGGAGAFTMGISSGFNECLAIVTSALDAANVKWEVKK